MRTKALLLTACLSALGSVSMMAQTNVYSLNIVGYVNLSLPTGFSMIACQFTTTNNTIGALLNNNPGGTVTTEGTAGPYEGVTIYKWNGSAFTQDTGDNILSGNLNGWDNNGVITLNPGEAAWLKNPNTSSLSVVFLGTVPSGTLTVPIKGPSTFNMISSPVPVGGDVVTNAIMNLTNYGDSDRVYVYANPGGFTTYTVDKEFGSAGYQSQWDPPGDPMVTVGQGFWYLTASTTTSFTWTETFSVNQ